MRTGYNSIITSKQITYEGEYWIMKPINNNNSTSYILK